MDESSKRKLAYILYFFGRGPFLTAILIILFPLTIDMFKYNTDSSGSVGFLVFKIKPSNILLISNSISSLILIVLSPVLGVASDYGKNRQLMIKRLLFVFSIGSVLTFVMVSEAFWWLSSLLLILLTVSFEAIYVLVTSYISEIGTHEKDRSFLCSCTIVAENITVICYLVLINMTMQNQNPRNLIHRGDFEVFNSYRSWKLESSGDIVECSKHLRLHVLEGKDSCWVSEAGNLTRKRELKIKMNSDKPVSLFQESMVKSTLSGNFLFTSELKASGGKATAVLRVLMYAGDIILYEKIGKKFELTEEISFIKTSFHPVPNAKKMRFEIHIEASKGTIVEIHRIETLKGSNWQKIMVMFIPAVWFMVFAGISCYIFNDSPVKNREESDENIFIFTLKRLMNSLHNSMTFAKAFIFVFGNGIWSLGYALVNILSLISLEEKLSLDPPDLAIVLLFICIFIILGAAICYKLEEKINQWNTALLSYSLWIVNPLFLFLMNSKNAFMMFLLAFVFGTSIGINLSLRYSIYSNLIPKGHAGEFMSILYVFSKITEFSSNVLLVYFLHSWSFKDIVWFNSSIFLITLLVLLPLILRERKAPVSTLQMQPVSTTSSKAQGDLVNIKKGDDSKDLI